MPEEPPQSLPAFLVIRHGRTDWNDQQRFQGRADIPLNEHGLVQAHEAAGKFGRFRPKMIISSPLGRARTTAELIAGQLNTGVEIEPDLIECDFGCFDGRPIPDVMREHGIERKEELAEILPSDAESWDQVKARAIRCISKWCTANSEYLTLFVSHDAVIQSLAEQLSGAWFDCRHGMPYLFRPTGGPWQIEAIGP